MPFGTTTAGDVLKCKLNESFGKIEQVIIIADDIMIIGCKPDHSDHDQAFTNLLQAAKECNIKLNYENLQYKQNEVEFFGETYNKWLQIKQRQSTCNQIYAITNKKETSTILYWHDHLLGKVFS